MIRTPPACKMIESCPSCKTTEKGSEESGGGKGVVNSLRPRIEAVRRLAKAIKKENDERINHNN